MRLRCICLIVMGFARDCWLVEGGKKIIFRPLDGKVYLNYNN